jgi:hypothetical protein
LSGYSANTSEVAHHGAETCYESDAFTLIAVKELANESDVIRHIDLKEN